MLVHQCLKDMHCGPLAWIVWHCHATGVMPKRVQKGRGVTSRGQRCISCLMISVQQQDDRANLGLDGKKASGWVKSGAVLTLKDCC